jgi:HEPN domain-containing protein
MNKNIQYREWLKIAESDLNSAIYLTNMHPKPLEIICYHCQQSAEKFLKAYLVLSNEKIKLTHDLTLLYKDCIKLDNKFNEIEESCINLTDFAINTRYPYPLEIDEIDMKRAISDATKIKEFILERAK